MNFPIRNRYKLIINVKIYINKKHILRRRVYAMKNNVGEFFTISELANEFEISTRTIRYYEEIGLIQPKRNKNTQHRSYSRADRARLKLILRGKRFGFTLDEIKEMIELFAEDHTGKKQLQKTIEYGDSKIKEIDQRINELQELKDELIKLRRQFIEKMDSNNK